jgi:CCR4-NOT transcription complex subunit 6
VFTYNILCDKYATPQIHGYTPSWALSWEYRKEMILQEILLYNADVVCLQEVETSQFEEYFVVQLKLRGEYEGLFYPKSRARTMADWEKKAVDGCAIFYKTQRYCLVHLDSA